jgi:hypothetical protein
MNLEEAHNNIGAEVELDESTKPYTCTLRNEYHEHGDGYIEQKLQGVLKLQEIDNDGDALIETESGSRENIHPRHLKLKLKPQNYKIHVPTDEESREAQRLFFDLGYGWVDSGKTVGLTECPYLYAYSSGYLGFDRQIGANHFKCHPNKQITLQELRDMVSKKKGIKSIGVDLASSEDKTVKSRIEPRKEMTWEYALRAVADGKGVEFYNDFHGQWWDISGLRISEITGRKKFRLAPQLTGTFQNFEPNKEMTWEDALDAFKEGKEVEVKNISWFNIKDLKLENIKRGTAFRLAPQRIILNGEYTKEELLQKVGEME